MQRAFVRSRWLKVGSLILVSVLLAASLFWVGKTFAAPSEKAESVTLLNYQHEGEFDYLVYVKPSTLFDSAHQAEDTGPPTYYTNLIDTIEVYFSYEFARDKPGRNVTRDVEVRAIVTGPSKWQKATTLVSSTSRKGDFTIHFPLSLDRFDNLVEEIEEELAGEERGYFGYGAYDLVIEARVETMVDTGSGIVADIFVHPMELKLGRSTLEWDNDLELIQRNSYNGFNYEHRGSFDYEVRLKSNSLYDTRVLRPPRHESPSLTARPPGEAYFLKILDLMKAKFSYHFVCDQPVRNLVEEVEVTAILEYPGMWSKTFTLVPKTEKSGPFMVSFPVDVNRFKELTDTLRNELGFGAASHDLTIQAVIHTRADTDFGPIDEVFVHTLDGRLEASTLTWGDKLDKVQPGSITGTATTSGVSRDTIGSPITLALALFGFLYVLRNYTRAKPEPMSQIEAEAQRARKKHKNVIVEVSELPPRKAEETVIPIESIDEIVKTADALLKPVLHQVEADKHTYCVIDGLTRYQYISQS